MDERNDLARIVGLLAVHVDARNWRELEQLFAPTVRVDYVSLFGGEARTLTREELVGGWSKFLPGFTRTCHIIGVPAISINGETAHAVANAVAWHFVKEPGLAHRDCWQVGGCYQMDFQRIDRVWGISALTLARAWAEGNLELPRIVGERAAHTQTAAGG